MYQDDAKFDHLSIFVSSSSVTALVSSPTIDEEYSSDDEKYDISEDDVVPAVPWDAVIVISNDEEPEVPAKKVSVKSRKCVFALVDESDRDDDCWSNAFLF
nr:hypothetical protein [Tanacetum cinerariifolium]